jgi:tetratricopeptide (TPR) repeat protein
MIWMGVIAGLFLLGFWLGMRRFGRQGTYITGLIGILTVGGASYLYWGLGAYSMSLSTDALNSLPENERAFVVAQAAQDQFMANGRIADQDVVSLFRMALDLDPNQITALGSLGIIAFERSDYGQAAAFWTRMLGLLPPESEQANAISAGIARANERAAARQAALDALPAAEIELSVQLSSGLPDSLRDANVFVFARAVGGSPRPVAARRLPATELPMTLTLSNQDALMGGRLYQGLQVEVLARMTMGDADGATGDWFSETIVLDLSDANGAKLVISPPAF